jgi:hypothetical protein
MSKGRDITKLIVLATVALLIIYDIAAYAASGVGATISRVTLSWSQDIPIVLIGIGVLIGHLFWPQPRPKKEEKN